MPHPSLGATHGLAHRSLGRPRFLQGGLAHPNPNPNHNHNPKPNQVATVTRSKAHRITVAAHTNNLAVVTTTWKQMAKTYCIKLQKFGLTSSIAPGDGGGDDGGSDGPETQ